MRITLKSKIAVSSLAFVSLTALAEKSEYFTLNGSQDVYIPLKHINSNNINTTYDLDTLNGYKVIKLMSITSTPKMIEKNRIALEKLKADGGEKDYSNGITSFTTYDPDNGSVDLGMENVPVLDQGKYGTCVTFSSTAALDARLKQGDYIDQQCTLELNKGLGNDYWNGADNATQIFIPLKTYGIITKGNCFGTKYADPTQTVTTTKYQVKSITKYSDSMNYTYLKSPDLNALKTALNAKHRVVIGTAIANIKGNPVSVNGFDITIDDNFPTNGGLWACQQPMDDTNYCPANPTAGHEVVVIGYDDNQQLLKIRNSWSSSVGDNGNYYMTYAFFNAMATDQTELK